MRMRSITSVAHVALLTFLACVAAGGSTPAHAQSAPNRIELEIGKGAGGDLELSWRDDCPLAGTDYAVYEGTLGQFADRLAVQCSTGETTAATVTPDVGATYYLVVPVEDGAEGSYGRDSAGNERPPAAGACFTPQSVRSCANLDLLSADAAQVARLDEVLDAAGALIEGGGRFADVAAMLAGESDVAGVSANGVSMHFTVGGLPTTIYDAAAARHGGPLNDVIPPEDGGGGGGGVRRGDRGESGASRAARLASGPVAAAAAEPLLPRGQRMVGEDDDGDGKRDLDKHALVLSPWAFDFVPNDSAPAIRDLLQGVRDYQEGSVTYRENSTDLLQDTFTLADYTEGWDDKDVIFLSSHGDADPNAAWGPDPYIFLGIGGSTCLDIRARILAEAGDDPENYPPGIQCSFFTTIGPGPDPVTGRDSLGTRAFWEWAHGGDLDKKVIWMETCRSTFHPGLAEALTGPDSIFFGYSDYVRVSVSLDASEAVLTESARDAFPALRAFVRECGGADACMDPPGDPTRAVLQAAWDRADLRLREALSVPAVPVYGQCAVSPQAPVEQTCPSCGGALALSFTYDIQVDGLEAEDLVLLQDPAEFGMYQLRLFADIDGVGSGYATPLWDQNMAAAGGGSYVNALPITLFGDDICPWDVIEYDPWVLLPTFDPAMAGNDARDRIYSWDGPFTIEIVPVVLP